MGRKVLIFGDIGIDDTLAIIYSYITDDIDVIGIVADYGNISRENAVRNIQYVGGIFTSEESLTLQIFAGAEIPMTAEIPTYVTEIHGEYGLGPIIPPVGDNDVFNENFFEVVSLIEENLEDLVIVNIGRLTSLATLFLLYGDLMKKVNAYYIMGGAFWVPGNVTAVAEANFHGDPVAAQIVLTYADNVTIIPLNVTEKAIATPEMVDYIDRVGRVPLIKTLLDYYYNFYKERNPNVQGSPLHDVLTLMAVNHEDMFIFYELPVHIVQAIHGTERGQSIADIRPFGSLEEETEKEIKVHRIAFELDYAKFFNHFMTTMAGDVFG